VETFSMSDFDSFERRLGAALRSDADASIAPFAPGSIARAAIARGRPRSLRSRLESALTVRPLAHRVSYLLLVLALALAVAIGAIAVGAFRTRPVLPPSWSVAGSMNQARTSATATLLPDGRVLVAGGSGASGRAITSAELYDPSTGSWVATGSMVQARAGHTATLLPDGKVLVAGGGGASGGAIASAELYDPSTGSWVATGSMDQARVDHTATLLPDGKVLVAGGFGVTSAELYDPRTGAWAPTGAMIQDRAYQTATLLPTGKVLVVGGYSGGGNLYAAASAEIYDPTSGSWISAGLLHEARAGHSATLLRDGNVLVVGGSTRGDSFHPTASAELFDPAHGSWTNTGSMIVAVVYGTATLLPNGAVILAGGSSRTSNNDPVGNEAPAELYDPESGSFTTAGTLSETRTYPMATLLQNGKVLVAGGRTRPVLGAALASAELYDPGSGSR
jgi:N-acetylneuraminic acid mutarotase